MNLIQGYQSLEACCGDLGEPRVVGGCDPIFNEIMLGAVSGAESWSEVEEFGEAKVAWHKQ